VAPRRDPGAAAIGCDPSREGFATSHPPAAAPGCGRVARLEKELEAYKDLAAKVGQVHVVLGDGAMPTLQLNARGQPE
jgi:hypothetical protein